MLRKTQLNCYIHIRIIAGIIYLSHAWIYSSHPWNYTLNLLVISCVNSNIISFWKVTLYRFNWYYYLFKKFLVSDWLTANCEIVISTQWRTKSGFFTFIIAKWRQRVNMKKIWTRLRHITMTTRIILTRWRHWYDDDDCRRTKELFFFL